MARQVINHGTVAGDGTGEVGFTAFQKTNANFAELYAQDDDLAASVAALSTSGGLLDQSVSYAPGASVNNAAPAGWDETKNRLLVTPNAGGSVITGLDSTDFVDGQRVLVVNVAAAGGDDLVLNNQDAASTAGNRFKAAIDFVVVAGQAVWIVIETSGWRIVG